MSKAAAKNSARRKLERLEKMHKDQEARVVKIMQEKRAEAEKAKRSANYYAAQARAAAATAKVVTNPTPKNAAAAQRAIAAANRASPASGEWQRRGRFTFRNSVHASQ